MIWINCGESVITGKAEQVLSDLTVAIKRVHSSIGKEFDTEFADMMIAECGRLAFMTEEELMRANEELMRANEELMREIERNGKV